MEGEGRGREVREGGGKGRGKERAMSPPVFGGSLRLCMLIGVFYFLIIISFSF